MNGAVLAGFVVAAVVVTSGGASSAQFLAADGRAAQHGEQLAGPAIGADVMHAGIADEATLVIPSHLTLVVPTQITIGGLHARPAAEVDSFDRP